MSEDFHNMTSNSQTPLQEPQYATALKITSLALAIFAGALGNAVVISTIAREKRLHKPPFYYLVSFSVADLARSVFCLPFVLTAVIKGSVWTYGRSACTLLAFTNSFFVYSSVFALLAIAVDRHLAVVHTKFHKKRSHGLVNLAVVVLGWGVAFVMSFPPVFGVGTYRFKRHEGQCAFEHRYYKHNDTLGFMLILTIIHMAIIFLYCRIFSFLRNHRKMRPFAHQPARSNNWTFFGPGANGQALINWLNGFQTGPPNPMVNGLQNQGRQIGRVVNIRLARNEHLTRLFFIVTIVFDVLWLPYIAMSFWCIFDQSQRLSSDFETIATWSSYLQVALNPLVYICCNNPFRRAIRASVNAYYKRDSTAE